MLDISSELASLFSGETANSGIVASGTFSGELAAMFGEEFGAAPERDELRQINLRKREGEAPPRKFMNDNERAENNRGKARRRRARKRKDAEEFIAVLDMETDPFDAQLRERIAPFCACLYSDKFETIVIWEENEEKFVDKLIYEIENLPGEFTIYAHNGGKFDFMFLIHKLRGPVSFKGRGIMSAKIGKHELRDSFHIIPEKLAAYKKDEMDYDKMKKSRRNKHRQEIIDYLISDCVYLFDIVKAFVANYGLKISIGQAAMHLLKKTYPECENLSENEDAFMRRFFFGGRVECIGGRGEFKGHYKLYDVNSMYPYVMAYYLHPIGRNYTTRRGKPTEKTCFIELECFSKGAFAKKNDEGSTVFPEEYGRYCVSIHEYKIAKKYKLISQEKILFCVDNEKFTTFEKFIVPLYENRLRTKTILKRLETEGLVASAEWNEAKKDDIFYKLLQNNAYGKFAQNPRRFKEFYITVPGETPDDDNKEWGEFPDVENSDYWVWSKPIDERRYNNVGTAASITGAARSVLLEARLNADDPIYCDTDSLICKSLRANLDPIKLGAWDCEAEMSHVLIAGKKMYAYEKLDGKRIIKSKGVKGTKWEDIKTLVDGGEIIMPAFAPTLTRNGKQDYIDRRIRPTTGVKIQ